MRFIGAFVLFFAFSSFAFAQQTKKTAPAFDVTSISGETLDSEKLKGTVVVLNLWFIGCPNCVEEIKALNEIVDEYAGKKVVFIGLATNDKTKLESFLKKNPFKYKIVPKAMQTILSFGEPDKNGEINIPFPMHVVIDRDGVIVVRRDGKKGLNDVKTALARQFPATDDRRE